LFGDRNASFGINYVSLGLKLHDPANKGFRIWYDIAAQGETPSANPGELYESFFTSRLTARIQIRDTGGG
jgi:hypothetical protein